MLNTPFSVWPSFTVEEIDAVSEVLKSNKVNYWTGSQGKTFEMEFSKFTQTKYSIALMNGTVALDLALYGLGIGIHNGGCLEDEVIVTPRTFIASVSAIINAGARPVFADVDRNSQNITPKTITDKINSNTRAILCVHLAGWPCDIDGIRDLIGRDIKIIEDCAQAHGSLYKNMPTGGLGDVAAWSFCQDKIMTTGGEGGMVTCNDELLWRKMWAYKDHGKSFNAIYERNHPPGFKWVHDNFGTNFRMTEMQSAIGLIQLRRMTAWTSKRNTNAKMLTEGFKSHFGDDGILRIPQIKNDSFFGSKVCDKYVHAYYKYYVFLKNDRLSAGWSRDRVIAEINKRGVPCAYGSCSEIYLEKAFENTSYVPKKRLPNAKELGETSMIFLVHPTLINKEIEKTVNIVSEIVKLAS